MQPLNPRLYAALMDEFDHVEIANPGQRRIVRYSQSPVSGRVRAEALQVGEEYRVNCPFCRDTKARFYINHTFGDYDPETDSFNYHLIHCFHRECQEVKQHQAEFRTMVLAAQFCRTRQPALPIPPVCAVADTPLQEIALPSGLVPLPELEPGHPARAYLQDRSFDPDQLWSRWQVSYCHRDPTAQPPIFQRLVVPIFAPGPDGAEGGIIVGWQARMIDEPKGSQPKYLTAAGMPKSRLLYNLPAAVRSSGPVYVCEGVTDCWRLEANAVALFGKTASEHQRQLLVQHFAGRPIVLFLDQDAQAEARKTRYELQPARAAVGDNASVVMAVPPPGCKDVGACSREEALARAAAALGRPLSAMAPDEEGPIRSTDRSSV